MIKYKKFFISKKIAFALIFICISAYFSGYPCCASEETVLTPEKIIGENGEPSEFERRADEAYDFFSPQNIFETVKNAAKDAFFPTMPLFAGLLGLIVISSVINAFNINFGGFDIGGYVSALCFSGYCFSIVKNLCENLTVYTQKLCGISALISPTLVAASAADGVMTAKTGYTGLVLTLAVIEFLVTSVALPCAKLLFVLSLVSCISGKTVDLKGISSSLRTFSVFFVSLVMTVIVTVMHFQNIIARAADSVGLRAVRFASASFVPIVGGLVGESVKTVTEALRAVSGITGAVGVAAIISACLPPLLALLIFKIEIIVCTCLAKTLSCGSEAAILSETNGILNVLNAALLASTIGFAAMICIAAAAHSHAV